MFKRLGGVKRSITYVEAERVVNAASGGEGVGKLRHVGPFLGLSAHGTSSDLSQEGPGFDVPFPLPPGMMMASGGPMMPPEFMAMAAMGGMSGGPMMPPRPRPPPGPPPSGATSDRSGGTPSFSPERPGEFYEAFCHTLLPGVGLSKTSPLPRWA